MDNESNFYKRIEEFEKGFPDGVYATPDSKDEPRIKIRAMDAYCRKKNIEPHQLTEIEVKQFFIYPKDK